MVQLAEGRVDQVLPVQPVAVAVVAVGEVVGGGFRPYFPPVLFHHPAETIEPMTANCSN